MLKKILGIVFLLVAALFLVLAVQKVGGARSIGFAVGSFIPGAFFALLGVFCLQKKAAPVAVPEQNSSGS